MLLVPDDDSAFHHSVTDLAVNLLTQELLIWSH